MLLCDKPEVSAADVKRFINFDGGLSLEESATLTLKEARQRFERRLIVGRLSRTSWDIRAAAESLAIERTNLYRKIKALDIELSREFKYNRA